MQGVVPYRGLEGCPPKYQSYRLFGGFSKPYWNCPCRSMVANCHPSLHVTWVREITVKMNTEEFEDHFLKDWLWAFFFLSPKIWVLYLAYCPWRVVNQLLESSCLISSIQSRKHELKKKNLCNLFCLYKPKVLVYCTYYIYDFSLFISSVIIF